ncbi:lysylphosphatidylglycerol synthase domain-containing protein [Parasphingorhabdus sp.]|uniref:lysylphosphatidylglycerol synthase domain-containing protein n=1 Tax=Parasphingorhabdus sp. TaxID=2709688 RepID=UPI00309B2910
MANPAAPEIPGKPLSQNKSRQSLLRGSVYVVGSILFVLAILYIAATVQDNWPAIATIDWYGMNYSWLALAAATYGCSLITTAMVWPSVITKWGHRLALRKALGIGLVAQIGKYLPGNVAHYFGRAALAKQHKVSFVHSGLSTIVEFGAALSAVLLLSFGATLLDSSIWADAPIVSALPGDLFWPLAMLGLICVVGIAAFALRRSPEIRSLLSIDFWIAPICWLTISFLMAGFSFYALAIAFPDFSSVPIISAIAIYAIAWAAGFLIPGAPAGLGVREVILLALLTPIMGAAAAVMLSIVHRLMSAIVDLTVSALAVALLLNKEPVHES